MSARQTLHIRADIQAALDAGQPVVVLESTLITHGLPHPLNIETALGMEAAVREGGALPATIAVLNGDITIGLTREQIDMLAGLPVGAVRKCSRRDLPIVTALRQHGATTVAGTMIIAALTGIEVFATGGIGGVHRGNPHDVSADLLEFGRTPVAVVASGAKSILDLPLTLEVLETQGVPVLGYGTDALPAFYAERTDLPIDQRVDSPQAAAAIIHAGKQLGAAHGTLVVAPVPADAALDGAVAEAAIARATDEALAEGVAGKDITPYVLRRVSELTAGESMRANIALLLNNARIAGQIAVALSRI
ncbi:MAG: pseudouridine-5'-phosphate glycosidase [Chloroflexi bacterium]|nr:pseudouridine-5'-phosphate glycosidase [Chloroflexota bacterium]MDE2650285.1 pseudouridine-5'-phosphate glycosidase [Chloroflexota bacterium]MXV92337.1 pseudouridine-5'-phosphate glycosidase [Chloroflexota bacterium]MXX84357.1 pseudouridine-5'-phosphate glycosidase [Chloroflexota bacterium]MYA94725.1 pseudouridine-5'-phosphate glycosidase [Chloroflexota bacterium]